jgi:copper chaperone
MEKNSFKTNINCAGCIARVTTTLDSVAGKSNWTVDIQNPNKILTITNSAANTEEIIHAIEKVGFKIEPLAEA